MFFRFDREDIFKCIVVGYVESLGKRNNNDVGFFEGYIDYLFIQIYKDRNRFRFIDCDGDILERL